MEITVKLNLDSPDELTAEEIEKDIRLTEHEIGWSFDYKIEDVIVMPKEHEAIEPKTGHWIFESAYCETWSHTCSECGKRTTTPYNTYASYCWNCDAKMERP